MKRFLKIAIAVILAITATLTLIACTPNDGSADGKKGLLVKKIDGVYTIYDYVDEGKGVTELDIGAILDQKDIDEDVKIKKGAFDGNNTLTKIIVPEQVVEVAEGAFRNMQKLKTLEVCFIGKTVNADAFELESATAADKSIDSARTIAHYFGEESYDAGREVTINYGSSTKICYMPITFENVIVNACKTATGKTAYSIPMHAFDGAVNLKSVTFKGNKLGAIGVSAFNGCVGLTSIELPATVKTVYDNAFKGCVKLSTVSFATGASEVAVKQGAFSDCTAIAYIGVKVATIPQAKTVDLSVVAELGKNALNFANEDATYQVLNGGSLDLAKAFGETKFA